MSIKPITLIKKFFLKSNNPKINLPEEITNFLIEINFSALTTWINSHANINDPSILFEISKLAPSYGWSELFCAKLNFAIYYRLGRYIDAINIANAYTKVDSFDADLFISSVNALGKVGLYGEAYEMITKNDLNRDVLDNRVDYHVTAALCSFSYNDLENTIYHINYALHLQPDNHLALLNASIMYCETGNDGFEAIKNKILQENLSEKLKTVTPSMLELAMNNYENGFRLYERRYDIEDVSTFMNSALFGSDRWQGEPLNNEILLISGEQGLGDIIQVIRFIKLIPTRQDNLIIEVQTELLSFLQFNYPEVLFLPRRMRFLPDKKFDVWCGIMSLPYFLKANEDNIPYKSGYLTPPPENKEYWHERVLELADASKPCIGIVWSGQPIHVANRRRSIPFSLFFKFIENLKANFFALQIQIPDDMPINVINVSEELITISDTAALIDEMDLVISIDSMPIHLAGALGKEAWLLLPHRYEWRWGLEGEKNNWYESVKVVRQKTPGDWQKVLEYVFEDLLPARFNLN